MMSDKGGSDKDLGSKIDEKGHSGENKGDDLSAGRPVSQNVNSNKRYQTLEKRKQAGIVRLNKAQSSLNELVAVYEHLTGQRSSKTSILHAIKKVRAEYSIIEEIVTSIKTTLAICEDEETNVDDIIDNVDQELCEIAKEVDISIKRANDQLDERIFNGETESDQASTVSSTTSSKASKLSSSAKRRQREWKEAHERLDRLEQEQYALEEDINKKTGIYEQNKKILEDARSIAKLSEERAKVSLEEQQKDKSGKKTLKYDGKTTKTSPTLPDISRPVAKTVKLKGVQLPTFSGEDKTKFEPWYAAFTSVVDDADIPIKEKMLRLQGCLTGKALETVRDFGFSDNAYERAKEKLKRKYGGKRRQTLTHLTTLRGLPKARRHNLPDMEELLSVLDRILIALQDGDIDGEMRSQHLNLTVKEKLPEEDIRAYKHWLHEHDEDDTFEKLVQWIEIRVQIMDEALEESGEFNKKKNGGRYNRGFKTTGYPRKCIVVKCVIDHPPWVCPKFKELSVTQRKELIAKSGRCFRCLAAGHQSKNCNRIKRCGIDGCESTGT
jgi:hypothetical protein